MERTLEQKSVKLEFHWNIGSWMGLLGLIQSVFAATEVSLFFGGLQNSVLLTVFQYLFAAASIGLFLDSTFFRKNSSRIFWVVLFLLLSFVYVSLEIGAAVLTRDATVSYITNNPDDFASPAARSTAYLKALSLCSSQLWLYGFALVFIVGFIVLSFMKTFDGEATWMNYTCLALAIFFVFLGCYAFSNLLSALVNFSATVFAEMVSSRSIMIYLLIAGVVSFGSDFDPDNGKTNVSDF